MPATRSTWPSIAAGLVDGSRARNVMLVPEGIPLELPSQLPGRNRWPGRPPARGDSHRPADRQHLDFPRDANVVHCAMLSIFCAPARYVQGRNATASLGAEM